MKCFNMSNFNGLCWSRIRQQLWRILCKTLSQPVSVILKLLGNLISLFPQVYQHFNSCLHVKRFKIATHFKTGGPAIAWKPYKTNNSITKEKRYCATRLKFDRVRKITLDNSTRQSRLLHRKVHKIQHKSTGISICKEST